MQAMPFLSSILRLSIKAVSQARAQHVRRFQRASFAGHTA
jgi:hypothetical protein